MKVTPWEEARLDAISAAGSALLEWTNGPQDGPVGPAESAVDAALTTLSRLGYRLVPAEATEDMIAAAVSQIGPIKAMTDAATEAGDVLKEGK